MKPELSILMLGTFTVRLGSRELLGRSPLKVRELLAFLALHPGRAHRREFLASLLWADADETHARKYLRQALWRLHQGLLPVGAKRLESILHVDAGTVSFERRPHVFVDAVQVQSVYESTLRRTLGTMPVAPLRAAVDAYRGELLEGCASEWCIEEREAYREAFLALLDHLIASCEATRAYAEGITYGARALAVDRAREQTHQALMRLHYLAGDRVGALRQYERCAHALRRDLSVKPDITTQELRREIRSGKAPWATDDSWPSVKRRGSERPRDRK